MPESTGSLKKMRLEGYSKDDFKSGSVGTFVAMVNPSSYKNNFNIDYVPPKTPGKKSENSAFNKMGREEISFDLVFDGTGIIAPPVENEGKTVAELIKQLKSTIYTYDDNSNEPHFVKVIWGEVIFQGRMNNMSIDYKMFSPNGSPVRAIVSLSFTQYKSTKVISAESGGADASMTKLVTVKDGDSLPALCHTVYGSSAPYLQIAKLNGLASFQNLVPGVQLLFPPLS